MIHGGGTNKTALLSKVHNAFIIDCVFLFQFDSDIDVHCISIRSIEIFSVRLVSKCVQRFWDIICITATFVGAVLMALPVYNKQYKLYSAQYQIFTSITSKCMRKKAEK